MISVSENTNKKREFWAFFIALVFLSLFMVLWCGPLSEYSGHDYYFHLNRFRVLIDALKEGNYPIYIDYGTLEGYGYFTKAFYPDLTILPFAAIGIIIGPLAAYNLMMFAFTVLCGVFMYFAVNAVFKNSFVAFVSSIVYTFSPYHLFDWYNRAALGEALSFTFLPIIFFGLYHIIVGDYKKWYILTIGYSLLIYTHLLSSFLTFIATVLLLLVCYKPLLKEPKRIKYLLLAAVVTIPVIASYLFPMFEQMLSNTFYYSINENVPGQEKQWPIEMFWGMLNGFIYPENPLHMINVCGTGPLLILLVLLRFFVRRKTDQRRMADLCLILGVIFLFMISSFFPWGRLPLSFVQFPWRLYEFVAFFFSIAGAYYLSVLLKSRKAYVIAGAGIVVIAMMMTIKSDGNYKISQGVVKEYAHPNWFKDEPSIGNRYFLANYEYLPVKVPSLSFINQRKDSVKIADSGGRIDNFVKEKGIISFNIETETPAKIELPLVYYKGYKAINAESKESPIEESDHGLVEVSADKSTDIKVYYEGTLVQKVSWYSSLFSIFILIGYIFYQRKRRDIRG